MTLRLATAIAVALGVVIAASGRGLCAVSFDAGTTLTLPQWNQVYYAPPNGGARVTFESILTYVRVTGGTPNAKANVQWNMELGCDEALLVDWDRGPIAGLLTLDEDGAFRRDAHGTGAMAGYDDLIPGNYHATAYANIYSPTPGWPPSKTATDRHPFGVVTQQGGGGGGGS